MAAKKAVYFEIDDELKSQVDAYLDAHGMTMKGLITKLLRGAVKKKGKRNDGTVEASGGL